MDRLGHDHAADQDRSRRACRTGVGHDGTRAHYQVRISARMELLTASTFAASCSSAASMFTWNGIVSCACKETAEAARRRARPRPPPHEPPRASTSLPATSASRNHLPCASPASIRSYPLNTSIMSSIRSFNSNNGKGLWDLVQLLPRISLEGGANAPSQQVAREQLSLDRRKHEFVCHRFIRLVHSGSISRDVPVCGIEKERSEKIPSKILISNQKKILTPSGCCPD